MTYEYKLSTGGYWLFTGRQALAVVVAGAGAMTPPFARGGGGGCSCT